MKAILLARVSTEDQDTKSQLIKLKEYADRKGLNYSQQDIFDFQESAYKTKRENFEEVINYIYKQKEKVALCCDKIDRLVRNFLHIKPIQELLESDKIELHFSSENLVLTNSSSATEKFQFNQGALLGQYFSDAISDNVKRSQYKRIKEGKILGTAPFGYRNITLPDETKTVEIDPFKSEVVIKIFDWYSTGAFSISEIKNKICNEFNVKLGKSTVADILENKFYIGIATYKKEHKEYRHIYPTLISERTFSTVQEIKAGRDPLSGYKNKYAGKQFYYRGLIKCAKCGYSISAEEHRGKNYYRCTEYGGKHKAKYVNEDLLTQEFTKAFQYISLSDETAQKLLEDLQNLNETNLNISQDLIDKLRTDQDLLRNRKSRLLDDYYDGSITKDIYEAKLKQYDSELSEIDDKLKNVNEVDKEFYLTAEYILQLSIHSSQLFERSEYEERRVFINTVLLNVTWDGVSLCYDYREPFNLLAEMNNSPVWGA